MPTSRVIPLAVLFTVVTTPTLAQQAPWFGIPTPEQRQATRERTPSSDQLRPLGVGPLPLVSLSDDPYADIRAEDLMSSVQEIVHFSELSRRAGHILWGRVMGTEFTDQAAQYMERRFREFDVERVWVEELSYSPQWWPTRARIVLKGNQAYGKGSEGYVLSSAMPAPPSPGIPGGMIEAEAVYVGNGRPADLLGRELNGRIAVMRSRPTPSVLFHSGRGAPGRLFDAGSAAVVIIFDDPGNHQYVPPLTAESDRGPTFSLGGDDGDFLEAVIGEAGLETPVRLRLELEVEIHRGRKVKNVFAQIPGNTDETILAIAHMDGWFYGAVDNASGLATLLAWAKHFGRRKERPRRNILLVATAGHHRGSPGTASLIEDHADLLDRTVLAINCEHTATVGQTRYANPFQRLGRRGQGGGARFPVGDVSLPTNSESPRSVALSVPSPFLLGVVREAIERYGLVVHTLTDHRVRGDAGPLGARTDLAVLNFIESNYWYHHTGDTVDAISPEGMERVARAFAHIIDRVDAAGREEIIAGE
jgi:hypothetical protein